MARDTLEEEQEEFLLWVGFCINAWSEIEGRLFNIFWRCIGSTQQHAAIIYYRTPTVDARLSLVDEIVRAVLPKRAKKDGGHDGPDVKLWASIIKDLRDHLAIRRRIAHHPLYLMAPDEDNDPTDTKWWWELYASDAELLRERDSEGKSLKLADLQAHLVDLKGLRVGLGDFLPRRLVPLLRGRVLPDLPPPKDSGPKKDQS